MPSRLAAAVLFLCSCATPRPPGDTSHSLQLKPYVGRLRVLELSSPPKTRVLFDTGGGLTLLAPAAAAQIDGLASLQTFSESVLLIDLAENSLEVHTSLPGAVANMREVPLRLSRCCAGAGLDAFVQVQGKNGPLWFELDSGNLDDVLISPRIIDQLELAADQLHSLSTGGPTDISIQITGLGMVKVSAKSSDIIYDGALNAEFFERTLLLLDLPHGRGWMETK